MSKIIIEIEASMIVPTIQVYTDYFNLKYPCTNEQNDGSNMTLEDKIKYEVYNFLLNSFNKCPDIYKEEYNRIAFKANKLQQNYTP